jgi:hypothetical protein
VGVVDYIVLVVLEGVGVWGEDYQEPQGEMEAREVLVGVLVLK